MGTFRDQVGRHGGTRSSESIDRVGANKASRPDQTVRGGKDESVKQYTAKPQQNSAGPGFKSPPWGKDD
jgi:hypothetical protein